MNAHPNNGIVTLQGHQPVDATVRKLRALVETKGVRIFAEVDHAREAAGAGMLMNPATLLIFGNPKAGTPLMVAAPTTAIDLPLKILIWEDAGGKVWVSYNSTEYLLARHGVPGDLDKNIAVIDALASAAAA